MKKEFLKHMQDLLKEDFDDYVKTLDRELLKGIRVNLLKANLSEIEEKYKVKKSLFSKEGYYMEENISGNDPYHLAGMFYIQEPSASSVIDIADIKLNDKVLDLCAAPGGKSGQIASKLQNTGLLVSNEIMNNRANILLSNLERLGVSENIITNSDPKTLCEEFINYFDKVIVDAPCSGEGMMKKHDKASEQWSMDYVLECAKRQKDILDEAYKALKPGGYLIYSTCTYSQEENEAVVYDFLEKYNDMELVDCNVNFGRNGIAYKDLDISKVVRILPMDNGEGHFIAKLRKKDSDNFKINKVKECKNENCELLDKFIQEQVGELKYYTKIINNKVYIKQTPFLKLKNSKVLRQGLCCGEIVKNRFEPHHHFYMSGLLKNKFKNIINLNDDKIKIFLSGNVLSIPCEKGYVALKYQNAIVGFGKSDTRQIKNKYPKGLRIYN